MVIFRVIIRLMQTLKAMKRSKADKLKNLRNNGMVPAVVYGALVENTPISISSVSFEKVFKIAGESNSIVLEMANIDKDTGLETSSTKRIDALIHSVQFHPVKGYPIHVDFLAIDMNKPIRVSVQLEFTGTAKAEKDGVGTLVKILHEVEIEALPKSLPHSIPVDISSLAIVSDQIHVKDIVLPSGVTIITDNDEVVALIAAMKEEKEEESKPIDLSAIEVEKKGKKEEAGEEAPKEQSE